MAHWSEIDENNIVIRVMVGDNNDPDEGYQWLVDNLGGRWMKTSFNTKKNVHLLGSEPFRKNYGEIGYTYDEIRDAFIPPYPSIGKEWILDEETCFWVIPTLE